MATAEETNVEEKKKSGLVLSIIVSAVIGFISGAAGFAVTMLVAGPGDPAAESARNAPALLPPAFIKFGELVVNLDEGRLNRYLRVSITLQVPGEKEKEVTDLLDKNKAILRSWLLSYLSDKQMEEIRGAVGQNVIRREIQDYFNEKLFPDGSELIHDTLFEEFTVQ